MRKCYHDKNINSCEYCSLIKKLKNQNTISLGNMSKMAYKIAQELGANVRMINMSQRLKNRRVIINPRLHYVSHLILMNPKNSRGYPILLELLMDHMNIAIKSNVR